MSTSRWNAYRASARALLGGLANAITGNPRYCIVCDRSVPCFLPWRGGWNCAPPAMRALRMIGSDLDHFACPRCGSTDRDRHLKLYFLHTGIAERIAGARVLHFAPERALEPWLESLGATRYMRADLFPARHGIERVDLQDLPFDAASFDIVIANHVLEHVTLLDSATAEIARVLRPGGVAILQTPWCAGLAATVDDPTVVDPIARTQLFGQDDHVRLFGRDVFDRIAATGLQAEPIAHSDALDAFDAGRYGINVEELLMLFRAPEACGGAGHSSAHLAS